MKESGTPARETDWCCGKCMKPLTLGQVVLSYGNSQFTVDLPRCESCGIVFIAEGLALGRMAEAEQILEDK